MYDPQNEPESVPCLDCGEDRYDAPGYCPHCESPSQYPGNVDILAASQEYDEAFNSIAAPEPWDTYPDDRT